MAERAKTKVNLQTARLVTRLLALIPLFVLGAAKVRLSGRPIITSGLEMVLLGGAVGAFGYGLGRLVSAIFGISI